MVQKGHPVSRGQPAEPARPPSSAGLQRLPSSPWRSFLSRFLKRFCQTFTFLKPPPPLLQTRSLSSDDLPPGFQGRLATATLPGAQADGCSWSLPPACRSPGGPPAGLPPAARHCQPPSLCRLFTRAQDVRVFSACFSIHVAWLLCLPSRPCPWAPRSHPSHLPTLAAALCLLSPPSSLASAAPRSGLFPGLPGACGSAPCSGCPCAVLR